MTNKGENLSKIKKSFKEMRLLVANSIVRNIENKKLLFQDIDHAFETNELLDEYSTRYFLLWLGTKYGLNIYTENIKSRKGTAVASVMETMMTTGWFPFQNEIELRNEESIVSEVNEFLDARIVPALGLIGLFYEHLTTHSLDIASLNKSNIRIISNSKYNRRIKGQFYTPPHIVEYCLQEALSNYSTDLMKQIQSKEQISDTSHSHIKDINILDPACGTGNFLLGAISMLESLFENQSPDKILNRLYGIDIDGRAASLSRISILLKLSEILKSSESKPGDFRKLVETLEQNIIVGDATYCALSKDSQLTEKGFDLVITNPPYVSFGSRDQQELAKSAMDFYKKFYPDSSEYKIRLNAIFHDVAYYLTKNGGRYALLVPNGFLTGRRYAKLRKAILKRSRIVSITELPDNTIANATVGRWCLAVFKKQETMEDYKVKTVSFCDKIDNTNSGAGKIFNNLSELSKSEYSADLTRLITADHQRIQLLFSKEDDEIVNHLNKLERLKSILRGHTGIRSRIGQKKIIGKKKLDAGWKKGLISGSSVTPFNVAWRENWINIDKTKLFSGGFDSDVVENEKILVRQTGDRIIAALDENGLYHLNNVHSFSARKLKVSASRIPDLDEVVAWMNSNLWRYIYRLKTREDGRALAQIDIETVEEMPVPKVDTELSASIKKLALKIRTDKERPPKLMQALNRLVYEAYGFSEKQVLYIEKELQARFGGKDFASALPLVPLAEAHKAANKNSQIKSRARNATIV